LLHLLGRLAVRDGVQVDLGYPEAKARRVGDRGDDRDLEAPPTPKLAEDRVVPG
jgi:hypothetical protein